MKFQAKDVPITWEIEAPILTIQESVSSCISVIESKTKADSGTFWTWENKASLFSLSSISPLYTDTTK